MDKLKILLNSYFWLIVVAFLIFVGVMTYLIYSNWQDGAVNRTVTTQTDQAQTAVKQAANANNAAINADIERRTEDAAREKIIKPKLDVTRRRSANSKAALEDSRKNYENAKNPKNLDKILDNSLADNCAELARLYPDVRFDDCGGN